MNDQPPSTGALGTARLYCESCGEETLHRILRVDRGAAGPHPRVVRGVARCRECRWTHPFESSRAETVPLEVVVSKGALSERRHVEVSPSEAIRVDGPVPGVEPPATVRRIDLKDGARAPEAVARAVATVWATVNEPRQVRVAVLEGGRSSTERVVVPPRARWTVGDELRLPTGVVTIVALRARHRTWRRPGDAFPAEEVEVVYGRRSDRPPAGRSTWRRVRVNPSSRASSISRSPRSRSSPGVRRKRTVPSDRRAAAGATHTYSSPS